MTQQRDEAPRSVGRDRRQPQGRLRRSSGLKLDYAAKVELVLDALFRHDPIQIAEPGLNPREYEPEARAIVRRLQEAQSSKDLQRIVHEEFAHWFGLSSAGPRSRYSSVATEIWDRLRSG